MPSAAAGTPDVFSMSAQITMGVLTRHGMTSALSHAAGQNRCLKCGKIFQRAVFCVTLVTFRPPTLSPETALVRGTLGGKEKQDKHGKRKGKKPKRQDV